MYNWKLIKSSWRPSKKSLGLYPDDRIYCFDCGNYPRSGAASFHSSICCLLSDKGESENTQSKLISFTKLW